jgi:hypothetical protein
MITIGRSAKATLVVLSVTLARNAWAEPPAASATATARTSTTATATAPAPAIPFFGLRMGSADPALVGLEELISSATKVAAARACMNRCPPPSWSVADPSLGPLGKINAAGLAMGASGAGFAIGNFLLRGKGKTLGGGLRKILQSLSIRPMPGGAGLAISF